MFEKLPALLPDPILGLITAYQADTNPNKVDLGAGVYKNAQGHTPIMAAVAAAQGRWATLEKSKVYTTPAGFDGFNRGMLCLLLGQAHTTLNDKRAVSVQTPGGCGALRIAAEMLKRCNTATKLWVSTPTWANHIPLLGSAGLNLQEYRYY